MIFSGKNSEKILLLTQAVLLILLAVAGVLLAGRISELANAASVIRYIGDASVDTQVLVKRELNHDPEDRARVEQLRKDIFIMLDDLTCGNPEKNIKILDDQIYQEELSRLYMKWRKVETMIDVYRQSRGQNGVHLFMLSIWHHDQAKRTLMSAERYSQQITRQIHGLEIIGLLLLLSLLATLPIQYRRIKNSAGDKN